MKKLIAVALLTLASLTQAQENVLGDNFSSYLAQDNRYQAVHQSIDQSQAKNDVKVYLHAYIDLSRIDAGLLKLIELQMKEAIKFNRLQLFWMAFAQGAQTADSILAYNYNLNSAVCKLIKGSKGAFAEADLAAAYNLGVQSRAPFCFVEDYFARLEKMGGDLMSLKKTLLTVKLKANSINFDELGSIAFYNQIAKAYKELILSSLGTAQTALEKTFKFNQEAYANLEARASDLATYIDCANLVSRTGERFICTPKTAPSPLKMNAVDTYKILFQGKGTGAFMPSLNIQSLMRAAIVYKTEVRPNDQLVDYFVSNLKVALIDLEDKTSAQQSKIITLVKREVSDVIESSEAAQIVGLRKILAEEVKEKLITDLYAFKLNLEDYVLFSGTKYDKGLREKIAAQYQEILNLYADISVTLAVPQKDILIDIGEGLDLIKLRMPFSQIGPVYLLGKSENEVNELLELLTLSL